MPAPMLALADDLAVAATALEDEVLRLTLVTEDAAFVLSVAVLAALVALASLVVARRVRRMRPLRWAWR
jgi:hypothetical protein